MPPAAIRPMWKCAHFRFELNPPLAAPRAGVGKETALNSHRLVVHRALRRALTGALVLLSASAVEPAAAQPWGWIAKLQAAGGESGDGFGEAVAMDGESLVVGAIAGDGLVRNAGAAHVYTRDALGRWTPQALLAALDGEPFDWFGFSVAVDGDAAAVGSVFADGESPDAGAAYVFRRDAQGRWAQEARLIAPGGEQDDRFGQSVALRGETLIVGAPQATGPAYQSGAAFVYIREPGGGWQLRQRLAASDGEAYDLFASSVALDGDLLVVGAPQDGDLGYASGAAYVFARSGAAFAQQAKLRAAGGREGDFFGTSVAASGARLLVGAPSDDARGLNAGAAFVFASGEPGQWTQRAKLTGLDTEANDQFGIAVSIDGGAAIIGAYWEGDLGSNSGAAYCFEADAQGVWSQSQKLTAFDGAAGDWFGRSAALRGRHCVVGAPNDDGQGAAYVFERTAPTLTIVGPCPGPMTLEVRGATPRGAVALLASAREGVFTLPSGPCAGALLDIRPPFAPGTPLLTRADAQGVVRIERFVPPQACGLRTQAVDVETCHVSNRAILR